MLPKEDTTSQQASSRGGASNQNSFYYCGTSGGGAGDQGVSASVDVVKFSGGNFNMKSWWIAFYFTDTAGLSKWTQWGYGTHKYFGNIPVLQTYQFTGGTKQIYPALIPLSSDPIKYGGRTTFSIYRVEGTTKWRYARDGVDINELDLGTTSIGSVEVKIESQSANPGNWSNKINVKNFSTLKANGSWENLPSGNYGGNFFHNTGLSIWPIEGKNQNPLLQPAEINLGGNGNQINYQSALW